MRILLVNHFPLIGSGSGTYTLNVAKGLVKLGHNVLVLVPEHTFIDGYPFPVETLIFNNGKGTNFDLPFNFPCFTTHPRSNVTFYELDDWQIHTYTNAWHMAIRRSIEAFHPDIIHANHVWIIPYVVSAMDIPYVITCHGTDLIGFRKDPRYREMALRAAEKASAIIAISYSVAAEAKTTYGLTEDKVHVIEGGFDPKIFRPMPYIQKKDVLASIGITVAQDKPMVVFVGKLTAFKGVDTLLRAAIIYESMLPGVHTLIIGDGEQKESLRNLSRKLGLKGIHFVGHQSQRVIAQVYNVADVCVFPSHKEPFGLVAVEALACGCPVIATKAGGFQEYINQQVGVLVPVNDYKTLANAIFNKISGESRQHRRIYAAKYALQNFSWQSQVRKIMAIYERLLV